jgi:dipeptidyl-peptidase-4
MPSSARHRLTLDAIFASKALDDRTLRAPQWLADSRRFVYLDRFPGSKLTTIWLYDCHTRRSDPLLDPRRLRYRKDGKLKTLPIHACTLSKDEQLLLLTSEPPARFKPCGDIFVYSLGESRLRRLTETDRPQYHPAFSPDGTRVGFVRDNDLWIVDIATGTETRLTHDGSETLYNGRCGWVYEEELGLARAWAWSPDGGAIAFLQQDEAEVPEVLLSQYDKPHADPRRTRYPKAGDPNPVVRLGFLHLGAEGAETRWADLSARVGSEEYYIAHLQWIPTPPPFHDGVGDAAGAPQLLVQSIPRLQNRLLLLRVAPVSGAATPILEETDEAWVDHPGKLHFVEGSGPSAGSGIGRFLWPSERSGWRHLYLYDTNGLCHGAVTTGDWDVADIAGVDAASGHVYITAAYPLPTERSILRVPLAGGAPERVTEGYGHHAALFSKDCARFIHTHSSLNHPPVVTVRASDGTLLDTLIADGSPNLERYGIPRADPQEAGKRATLADPIADPVTGRSAAGWQLLTFRTDDGEELHARMLLPRPFDPARQYPALMHTYGGPGSQVVMNAWGGKGALWYHYLAEHGYVVFLCDNRGTGGRGRAFKKITYQRLGDWEVRDQIAGARFLGSLPFVDARRIAIWGWSYGGYMASNLILKGADVFRAAIAVAPVTDWTLYDTIYTERYMRRPCDNPDGYREGSPVHFAGKLKGRFLLIHGTNDDNVHFQNAARLASALQDKRKPFETMFYPGRHHGIENRHLHLYRLMTEFLRRTLRPSGVARK